MTEYATLLTPEKLNSFASAALRAALSAGDVISKAIKEGKTIDTKKGDADLVTETDKACEKLIFEQLRESFPDHCFIGEEDSSEKGATPELTDAPTWMVDPVDGTTNFVHGYPFVCVCVGLTINKKPVVGVVHNPILKETFRGTYGLGAFLNDEPIKVSDEARLSKSVIATEIGVARDTAAMDAVMGRFRAVCSGARSIRCCGSCAMNMCGVAMGRLDGFWEVDFGGCWDTCAAAVVVTEAGGEVLDPTGAPFDIMNRRVLATNGKISEEMAEKLTPLC